MSDTDDSISVIVIGVIAVIMLVFIIGHLPSYMQYILFPILGIISVVVIGKFNGGVQSLSDITTMNVPEKSIKITTNEVAVNSAQKPNAITKVVPEVTDLERLAAETARKQAQVAWALIELNRKGAPVYRLNKKGELEEVAGDPNIPRVIIMPVFKYYAKNKQWLPTEDIIRQGANKAFASLLLMGYPASSNNCEHWKDKQWVLATNNSKTFLITCMAPMRVDDASKYEVGMLLAGRIDTAYTHTPPNPKNINQDKWFISREAADLDIPVTDEAGNVYYQKRYFEDDLTYPITKAPVIANLKEIQEITKRNNDCKD